MGRCIVNFFNKFFKFICVIAMIVIIFFAGEKVFNYYHFGYSIKNVDVKVDITSKKEYNVTETIDVNFHSSKSGITKRITANACQGEFVIKDISVDGEKFEVSDANALSKDIVIGDQDKIVTGDKKYVVHYTLKQYDDLGNNNIDLCLLESNSEIKVDKLTAQIKLPGNCKVSGVNSNLFKDKSNERINKGPIDTEILNNLITINYNKPIPAKTGVNLIVDLDKNYFNISKNTNNDKTYYGDIKEGKDSSASSFLSDNNIMIPAIAFIIIVAIGTIVSISNRRALDKRLKRNLELKRAHPDSIYYQCCVNDQGEDYCCGNTRDDYY